jgi:3-oxoacyl-[acyl-carrier-protein] synthase II
MTNIYIRSMSNISPQRSFRNNQFPRTPLEHMGNRLNCLEPDYQEFIDAKSIRRMSRMVKMGVVASLACLKEGGLDSPDAIVTGTAYGCLQDTESFLTRLVENDEELLSPTSFIQSTHNTAGAQIALRIQCHGYNNTFVHRGFSFESAMLDAIMLLKEKEMNHVLVGGLDELTDSSFAILQRMGLFKKDAGSSLDLTGPGSKGTIGGEGVAFFLLSHSHSVRDYALVEGISTLYKPANDQELQDHILHFLEAHSTQIGAIDLLITGRNGDWKGDQVYERLDHSLFHSIPQIRYKSFCGEYPTSSAFALWLAATLLKSGESGTAGGPEPRAGKPPSRLLIYNHYQEIHHSLFLVSAC